MLLLTASDLSPSYWLHHPRAPVDLSKAINALWNEGVRIFVELGPKPVLIKDAESILGKDKASEALMVPTLDPNEDNLMTVIKTLGKLINAELQEIDVQIFQNFNLKITTSEFFILKLFLAIKQCKQQQEHSLKIKKNLYSFKTP